jgi:hypothetical protein
MRRSSLQNDDARTEIHPLEEIEDVMIVHADAAIGDETAN